MKKRKYSFEEEYQEQKAKIEADMEKMKLESLGYNDDQQNTKHYLESMGDKFNNNDSDM